MVSFLVSSIGLAHGDPLGDAFQSPAGGLRQLGNGLSVIPPPWLAIGPWCGRNDALNLLDRSVVLVASDPNLEVGQGLEMPHSGFDAGSFFAAGRGK